MSHLRKDRMEGEAKAEPPSVSTHEVQNVSGSDGSVSIVQVHFDGFLQWYDHGLF